MKRIRLVAIIEATTITGPAKNLLQYAQQARLAQDGPTVEVMIVVFQRGSASNLFIETARQSSIPIYPIPETGRFDHTIFKRLQSMVRELKPDLIQGHAVKSHLLIRAAGLHHHAPFIAFHHGYTWPDLRMRVYNQFDLWSLRAATRVITVSQSFRQELIRKGVQADRIDVVHNAIDPNWGARDGNSTSTVELRARLGVGAGKSVVLIVGRLSNEKDHRTLLQAIHLLRSSSQGHVNVDPHLLIVGDGAGRRQVEADIRSLGLAGSVTIVGQVNSTEAYYRLADVSVLSSLNEGSPNALLEAMAARVPVVATSVGGIPEIVSNGESALLVEPGNSRAMAQCIAEILTDDKLAHRLTGCAYEAIITHHTPASRASQLTAIYSAATVGPPPVKQQLIHL